MKSSFLKCVAALTAALLMMFSLAPAGLAAGGDSAVSDTNAPLFAALEAAGKTHANTHYYTIDECRSWTGTLNLRNQGITDITGLWYCTGITTLNLGGNAGLSSILPLEGQPDEPYAFALRILLLDGTNVSDMPHDLQMPMLAVINLNDTPITDSGLDGFIAGNLPRLNSLELANCSELHNITSLTGIGTLVSLYLVGSAITGLPDMSGMTDLYALSIGGTTPQYVGDSKGPALNASSYIGAVATLPQFKNANSINTWLSISNTNITDASFLNSCAGLKQLYWRYMDSAPSVFPTSANLHYLDLNNDTTLGNGALASIAAIPCFHTPGATPATLSISATNVTDVSGLSAAAGLRALYWQDMPSLTAATGLGSLTQLVNVDLVNDTGLHNAVLTSVAALPNINTLGIGNCGITDLSGISTKTTLTNLAIGKNKITSLEPLSGMTNLNALTMNNNYVADLSPLEGKPITRIDCSQNYLDPTPGSADMQILDSLPATGSNKNYENSYTIILYYDPNMAGAPSIPVETPYYEQSFTPPTVTSTDPDRTFIGWDADASDGTAHLDVPAGQATSVTLPRPVYPGDPTPTNTVFYTAIFGYNVSLSSNNSAYGTVTGAGAYQSGTSPAVHAVPNTGYHFVRWMEGGSPVSASMDYTLGSISGAHTLVAEFAPNTYTVSVSAGDAGMGTVTGGGTYSYGSTATLKAAPNTGYAFARWTEGGSAVPGAGAEYSFTVTGLRTLVAEFGINVYTVTFEPNGGTRTGGGELTQTVPHGGGASAPELAKTGYTPAGWYREATCQNAWNFNTDTVKGDITLYAKWAANTYTVSYNANGGTGAMASVTHTYDVPQALTASSFARPGYAFAGWAASPTGEIAYTDGQSVSNLTAENGATVTLYARWQFKGPFLSGIKISAGKLSKPFSRTTYSYKLRLGENVSSVTVTPLKEYDGAVMTINGKKASSITVSPANGKSVKITVKVKYGKKIKTYAFTVTRDKSTDNNLTSLTASAGTFNTPFDAKVTKYTLTLAAGTKSVTLRAAAAPLAKASAKSVKVTLKNGQTKVIKITVKAQSGAKKSYVITVIRT